MSENSVQQTKATNLSAICDARKVFIYLSVSCMIRPRNVQGITTKFGVAPAQR